MANFKTGVTRKQSTPNFPKNEHFLPQEIFVFWNILLALFSCNTRFENLTFALLPFALRQLNSRVVRKKIILEAL